MSNLLNILLASSLLDYAQGSPTPQKQVQIPTRIKRNTTLPFYYPKVTQEAKGSPSNGGSPSTPSQQTPAGSDLDFGRQELIKRLGIKETDFKITQSNTDKAGVLHIYASEIVNGIVVDNHNAAIHVQNGKVISFSSSFTSSQTKLQKRDITVASPSPPISLADAVKAASAIYGAPQDSFPAKLVYVSVPSGDLVLAHQFQLRDDSKNLWYQISVDAATGKVVQAVDYTNELTIKAIGLPKIGPNEGFDVLQDPGNAKSSPMGWNNDGAQAFTDTRGNNVISGINGVTVDGGAGLNFDSNWNGGDSTSSDNNKRAAVINNFYISNVMHDITYQYGFDEASGNFQTDNFGKGGVGNDGVILKNQADGSNNANFMTPPDGQSGVMQMYTFTTADPQRDSALDNHIVIHEYMHGVSNRLTGGSAQGNCLGTTIAGGMGEGWSDTVAIYLTRTPSHTKLTDAALAPYASNNDVNGLRSKPYSTSMNRNPYTFSHLRDVTEVHAIGEVWANILYQMFWNLVEKEGFSTDVYDATQIKGNVIALQLVIGGMKLQPCNPTFTTARDAILTADQVYYKGAYKCMIWRAFAKRGLGTDADESTFTDGFAVPSECAIPREGRLECGFNGISEDECDTRGCTWSPLENGSAEPWCFRPVPKEPRDGRLECGYTGITQAECQSRSCTWSPLEVNSKEPWCFRPTPPEPREGRLECGQVGTTQADCAASGCTWSPLEVNSKEPWCFRPVPAEPREGRLECGKVGTTQSDCTTMGCTWSPLENGSAEPWCFRRSFPRENRVDCGHVGTTESECKDSACIWSPLEDGSAEPWCFRYQQ